MAQTFLGQKRLRKYYGKIREVLEMPNLIEVQKSSYDLFLRSGDAEQPTDGEGIKGVFQSVFPIKDFNETSVLEFVKYDLEKPKYDVEECMQRDMTYSAPLKVTLRLIVFDRVPWPRPTILHKARRGHFGGKDYDDAMTRLKLKQAFGRLIRSGTDSGHFIVLSSAFPSRLLSAFPPGVTVTRLTLDEALQRVAAGVSCESATSNEDVID